MNQEQIVSDRSSIRFLRANRSAFRNDHLKDEFWACIEGGKRGAFTQTMSYQSGTIILLLVSMHNQTVFGSYCHYAGNADGSSKCRQKSEK